MCVVYEIYKRALQVSGISQVPILSRIWTFVGSLVEKIYNLFFVWNFKFWQRAKLKVWCFFDNLFYVYFKNQNFPTYALYLCCVRAFVSDFLHPFKFRLRFQFLLSIFYSIFYLFLLFIPNFAFFQLIFSFSRASRISNAPARPMSHITGLCVYRY